MQAIVLAAGMGRRLGALTRSNTKCMIPVNGVPLIKRMLEQLDELALNRIVLVIGYEGDALKEYIASLGINTPITYVNNPVYHKTNNIYSLALAKKELQEDDTLLLESDLIFESAILTKLLNDPHPDLALISKYDSWMDGTMVKIDHQGNILNFVHKNAFDYNEVDSYYKTVNIYRFSKQFSTSTYVPFLEAYMKALGLNEYYEQVLRVIVSLDKSNLKALVLEDEKWYEIDDIQDLDIAETVFAEDEQRLARYQKRYGGYWRFPKLLDYCYLVNPYFPSARMKEELRANFDILLTEYPSGMGVNSLVASKYLSIDRDYVCVGNGAAELIKSLMEYLSGKMGVIYPTFEEYPNRKERHQLVAYSPDNRDFAYCADHIIRYFEDKELDTLLLINPDNPSGNLLPKQGVEQLLAWTKQQGIRLIVDESFLDFSDEMEKTTLLNDATLEANPHLILIKSISKSYGVPGLRLGMMATSDSELLSFVRQDLAIWNINSFAEYYMQIFNKYEHDYKKAREDFRSERQLFYNELLQVPFLRVIPSQANYFLCEVTDRFSSKELTQLLLNRHDILIKDCATKAGFNGENYIRLAIRDRNDNKKLSEVLMSL